MQKDLLEHSAAWPQPNPNPSAMNTMTEMKRTQGFVCLRLSIIAGVIAGGTDGGCCTP
jgi:hypothetical protein